MTPKSLAARQVWGQPSDGVTYSQNMLSSSRGSAADSQNMPEKDLIYQNAPKAQNRKQKAPKARKQASRLTSPTTYQSPKYLRCFNRPWKCNTRLKYIYCKSGGLFPLLYVKIKLLHFRYFYLIVFFLN